jgi:hypothetical protein
LEAHKGGTAKWPVGNRRVEDEEDEEDEEVHKTFGQSGMGVVARRHGREEGLIVHCITGINRWLSSSTDRE